MKEITLDDVTQTQFDEASRTMIDMIRTKYPKLDLRNGTVLRDLLINPDATVSAWFSAQAEEQRKSSSLKLLEEISSEGGHVDIDDVNAVLSNFNMTAGGGSYARGTVRLSVNEERSYTIVAGFTFSTVDGIIYTSEEDLTFSPDNPLYPVRSTVSGSFYFIVPVVCRDTGSAGNIPQGTALEPETSFLGFISASAYEDFSGGADVENLASVISRIPVAVSQRGLITRTSAEAQLRGRFDGGDNPIIAVSSVGYGNPAQLRDRHNAFNIGVGGRVDLYVRNFTEPYIVSITKDVVPDNGSYKVTVSSSECPGMYYVKGVFSAGREVSGSDGSMLFTTRYFSDANTGWHDIKTSDSDNVETANSVYRNVEITIPGGTDGYTGLETVQIQIVALPEMREIQQFIDGSEIRNTGSDFIARCPMICEMSVHARVRHSSAVAFDVSAAKAAMCSYVNSTGFVKRITRSEIACILRSFGADSVPMPVTDMLHGVVYDGNGVKHTLKGDSLELSDISLPDALLSPDTCVFTLSPENVSIEVIS